MDSQALHISQFMSSQSAPALRYRPLVSLCVSLQLFNPSSRIGCDLSVTLDYNYIPAGTKTVNYSPIGARRIVLFPFFFCSFRNCSCFQHTKTMKLREYGSLEANSLFHRPFRAVPDGWISGFWSVSSNVVFLLFLLPMLTLASFPVRMDPLPPIIPPFPGEALNFGVPHFPGLHCSITHINTRTL